MQGAWEIFFISILCIRVYVMLSIGYNLEYVDRVSIITYSNTFNHQRAP